MATTMTLKSIPDEVYERLKMSAAANRRSLNREAIACLAAVLLPTTTTALEHLERARATRTELHGRVFKPADIDRAKRSGRA